MTVSLRDSLTLPCGAVLPNRLCKAAMTEGIANARLQPTDAHVRLYRQWSQGGSGLLITGNVMIDRRVLERPGNVAMDGNDDPAALRAWAQAGTEGGNHLWMQISHAGRQSPRYVTREPLAPSAVQLDLLGNYARPRALTEAEIVDFVGRFARVATQARDAGFTGVQIHAAHGYLLSSFLSPVTNQRTDAWGGSLENRARFLVEVLRAVRRAVGADFPIGVKLNSDDFRKGGFSHTDCLQVVSWLNNETVDLLEVSGGTYEQPRLLGFDGRAATAEPRRASTVAREAYFLDYARALRGVARMPMMVTGGFRSLTAMQAAIDSGDCDVIGLARPLCTRPGISRDLLSGAVSRLPDFEASLRLGPGRWLGGASPIFLAKIINVLGQQGWYYQQIARLSRGQGADLKRGVLRAFFSYLFDEYRSAWRVWRARGTAT